MPQPTDSMHYSLVPERAIGGVFAASAAFSDSNLGSVGSLWDHWTAGAKQVLTFQNARSAFAHVVRHLGKERVWIPAYCCRELCDAVQAAGREVLFYTCDQELCADTDALSQSLRPGDIVLGVNYFGRPAMALRLLADTRPDVIWVEDCAQSIDTALTPWAKLQLYSPRKLLGVADGGVLVDRTGLLPIPRQRPAASATLHHAGQLRRYCEAENQLWYAAFQRAESQMGVTDRSMSAKTLRILQNTALGSVTAPRRQNYAHLHAALSDLALWSDPAPAWTPLGFPIRVPDAAGLFAELVRCRIFAPRHWSTLAPDNWPTTEQSLSRQLLTLPCDQRYTLRDMDFLVETLVRCTS